MMPLWMPSVLLIPPLPEHTTSQREERSSTSFPTSKKEKGPIKRLQKYSPEEPRQRRAGRKMLHTGTARAATLFFLPLLFSCFFLWSPNMQDTLHKVDLKEVTVSDNTSTALWEHCRDIAVALYYEACTETQTRSYSYSYLAPHKCTQCYKKHFSFQFILCDLLCGNIVEAAALSPFSSMHLLVFKGIKLF